MLQEAVENYIASLSAREYKRAGSTKNTIMAYRNDLSQLSTFLQLQGLEDWLQVTREHIASYLLEMREGRAYRPTTIARKMAAFKSFFRYLYKSCVIAQDPVEKLESPRVQKDPPQVLSPEQVGSLFRQVEGSTPGSLRDLAMLHVLYATGVRVSELISLNVIDFDASSETINCPGRGEPARRRILPLSAMARDALQNYLELARPRLIRRPEEPAMFLNHHGERLTRQGFWLIIKGYAKQTGVEDITPHMLRHSFAIMMLREGKELRSVQKLLGHAHISTTQIYSQIAHLDSEEQ